MNARRKKFIVVFVCASASAVLLLVWKSFYRAEPVYNGKPLTAWIDQWTTNQRFFSAEAAYAHQKAQLAIRASAKDGIPFLLDLMRVNDSALKRRLQTLLPIRWHQKLRLIDESRKVRRLGANGLAALGTNAAPAVLELVEIAEKHSAEDGRFLAVSALKACGTAAEPAIPFLIQCLTNNSSAIRYEAAIALGNVHSRPEIVVPALIKQIGDRRTFGPGSELIAAIYAIGQFGTNAKSAGPVLVSLLNNSDPHVRKAASLYLPIVDSESAARERSPQP